MSSPSNVKADGVVPKNDGHVARRDPSPEDVFNCSSSDRPPKHTVRKPKYHDRGLSSIWSSNFLPHCLLHGDALVVQGQEVNMMWFWNFPLYMPQHPSSRAGRASQSPACGGLQVKLALSCKNLAVAETSGYQPPDPYAVLLASDSRGNWEEVSRTEVLQNSRGTVHTLRGRPSLLSPGY